MKIIMEKENYNYENKLVQRSIFGGCAAFTVTYKFIHTNWISNFCGIDAF